MIPPFIPSCMARYFSEIVFKNIFRKFVHWALGVYYYLKVPWNTCLCQFKNEHKSNTDKILTNPAREQSGLAIWEGSGGTPSSLRTWLINQPVADMRVGNRGSFSGFPQKKIAFSDFPPHFHWFSGFRRFFGISGFLQLLKHLWAKLLRGHPGVLMANSSRILYPPPLSS